MGTGLQKLLQKYAGKYFIEFFGSTLADFDFQACQGT